MKVRPVIWLPLLLALHIALALGYRAALPLFNWPDEPAHLNHVRAVATGDLVPTMAPGAWAVPDGSPSIRFGLETARCGLKLPVA